MVDMNDKKLEQTLVHKAELMQKRSSRTWSANFGMIASLGGVIIVPILLGLWCGSYLDEVLPQRFSWRLTLLFVGLVWGFFNAYCWIKIENEKIDRIGRDEDGK
ncbi:MAG: AtpZ/AtpI family protein [Alphaproteobacteria bacterium]|nr:AtpZ/AtpI family protein [Alphaproteobacteria bacterium]